MVVTMVHFFLLQLETFSAARMKLNFRYNIWSEPQAHGSTATDWIILSVKRHLHSLCSLLLYQSIQHRKYSKIYFVFLHFLQGLTRFGSDYRLLVTITYYTIVRRLTEPGLPWAADTRTLEPAGKTSGGQSEPTSSTKSRSKVFKRFNPAKRFYCVSISTIVSIKGSNGMNVYRWIGHFHFQSQHPEQQTVPMCVWSLEQ